MPEPGTITKSKSPSTNELKDRVRELELELAAYRIFGTPLEIAIAIFAKGQRCYWCDLPIDDFQKVQLIETSSGKYWLHEHCLDQGVDRIRETERREPSTGLVKTG